MDDRVQRLMVELEIERARGRELDANLSRVNTSHDVSHTKVSPILTSVDTTPSHHVAQEAAQSSGREERSHVLWALPPVATPFHDAPVHGAAAETSIASDRKRSYRRHDAVETQQCINGTSHDHSTDRPFRTRTTTTPPLSTNNSVDMAQPFALGDSDRPIFQGSPKFSAQNGARMRQALSMGGHSSPISALEQCVQRRQKHQRSLEHSNHLSIGSSEGSLTPAAPPPLMHKASTPFAFSLEEARRRSSVQLPPERVAALSKSLSQSLSESQYAARNQTAAWLLDPDGTTATTVDLVFIVASAALIFQATHAFVFEIPHDPIPRGSAVLAGVIQLLTLVWMYSRSCLRTSDDWMIIDELKAVRLKYLRGWFVFDALYAVPIEFVALFMGQFSVYRTLSLRQLLRVVRFIALQRPTHPLCNGRQGVTFATLVVFSALFYHSVACVFRHVENSHRDGVASDVAPVTYAKALHWAMVGFGDAPPYEWGEFYSCIASVGGLLITTVFTTFATTYLTSQDAVNQDVTERKDKMHSMLAYYNIPWDVQKHIVSLFPSVIHSQNEIGFKDLISTLPTFVGDRVDAYVRAKLVASVPLFKGLKDEKIVLKICMKLQQVFAPQGDAIITIGGASNEMFFLVHGVVDVIKPRNGVEQIVASFRDGSFFGEFEMMDQSPRCASVIAATVCELLLLQRDDFMELLNEHRELEEKIVNDIEVKLGRRISGLRTKSRASLKFRAVADAARVAEALHKKHAENSDRPKSE